MINTTTDFIDSYRLFTNGDIPGLFVIRGENSYENIDWNVGIVTSIPTKQQVLDKAQELYDGEAMNRLRLHRNVLMLNCDLQGSDSPLSDSEKTQWATYRQFERSSSNCICQLLMDHSLAMVHLAPTEPS